MIIANRLKLHDYRKSTEDYKLHWAYQRILWHGMAAMR
jgi:hypothetical protein